LTAKKHWFGGEIAGVVAGSEHPFGCWWLPPTLLLMRSDTHVPY